MSKTRKVTLYVDGASKGNPGEAGIGVIVVAEGQVVERYCDHIGRATNNAAEYQALIKSLEIAEALGAEEVSVMSDSQLIVNQMMGVYRVRHAALLPLYREARSRSGAFRSFCIRHVSRSENSEADHMANEGIQRGRKESYSRSASEPDGRAGNGEESPSSTGQDAG